MRRGKTRTLERMTVIVARGQFVAAVLLAVTLVSCGHRQHVARQPGDEQLTCAQLDAEIAELERAVREDYYLSTPAVIFGGLAFIFTLNPNVYPSTDDLHNARRSALLRRDILRDRRKEKCV